MSLNMVTVTVSAQGSPADSGTPEGNFVFVPNGVEWPGTPGSLPVTPRIQEGTLTNGSGSVSLVASDNFNSGVLNWDIEINIQGMPTVSISGVPVNYATGASQSVWDILNAAGWVPVGQP